MAFRVFVLTASDAGSRGEREDKSGPCIEEMVTAAGYEVTGRALLPDDREALAEKMREVCDNDLADLLLTTGGTGFSPTPRAMLSRASAGIRKGTLIVNLPGSPKAVKECLEFILPALEHGLEILRGTAHNCART